MSKRVIVENDSVEGTDTHNVLGTGQPPSPAPPAPGSVWTASFGYVGKMTTALSNFVQIDGTAIALVSSQSSLNPREDVPGGGHHADSGRNFIPPPAALVPVPMATSIVDPIGIGNPNAGAGSSFVRSSGHALLLDGDAIDTCDGLNVPANSTVSSENQEFVSCSE